LHAVFHGKLSIQEIDALKAAFAAPGGPERFKGITKESWKEIWGTTQEAYQRMTRAEKEAMAGRVGYTAESLDKLMKFHFEDLGKELVSEGEALKVSIEDLQYTVGKVIGPLIYNALVTISNNMVKFLKALQPPAAKAQAQEFMGPPAELEPGFVGVPESLKELGEWDLMRIKTFKYLKEKYEARQEEVQKGIKTKPFKQALGEALSPKRLLSPSEQRLETELRSLSYKSPEELWGETQAGAAAWQAERQAERNKPRPQINLKLDVNLSGEDALERKILEGFRRELEDRLPEMMDRAIESGIRRVEFNRAKVTSHIQTD